MDQYLIDLAARAFGARISLELTYPDVVVRPAVPVLYFGDHPAYTRSRTRVITVGLNPSQAEFPAAARFSRFPGAEGVGGGQQYLGSLDHYFTVDPLWRGSTPTAGLLEGLGTSFETGANTALHTDLGSPVATSPTWSRLSPSLRREIATTGIPLWADLVRHLLPHVILVSVARQWLNLIPFPVTEDLRVVETLTARRKRPYPFRARRVRVTAEHDALLISGPGSTTPFGNVSRTDQRRVGATISGLVSR